MNEHSIGKTIATLRKTKGWTQVELAEKLNVSDKAVSKWESEAGFPEISQLPAMATLFGVTIDYLMTGKRPEKEIVAISKAELCAKTDDISMLGSFDIAFRDEKHKNLADYVIQYKSKNIYYVCKDLKYDLHDEIKLALIFGDIERLKNLHYGGSTKTFDIRSFVHSKTPYNNVDRFLAVDDDITDLIANAEEVDEQVFDFLISPIVDTKDNVCRGVWHFVIPFLFDACYKQNNMLRLEKLLQLSKENNTYIFLHQEKYCYGLANKHNTEVYIRNEKNCTETRGLIIINCNTIQLALSKGDFDFVLRLNEINTIARNFVQNCCIASADEIRIAKLKLDKSVSITELQIQSAIHNGIINIKELKGIADFAAVKKALNDYPVHPFELVYRMYEQQKWRELFEFSVDYDIYILSDAILHRNKGDIEENILEIWTKDDQPYNRLKSLCFNNAELYVSRSDISYSSRKNHNQKSVQDVVDYLNEVRQRIINELSNKFDKEKIVGELTKDYFYSELSRGNNELVIIKLCVRMEAILKCDYSYQGDFSEMLDSFCGRFYAYDDEDDNYDSHIPAMLNRLRRQRNSIVHSEKTVEPMSDDEIKQCIEYICSL